MDKLNQRLTLIANISVVLGIIFLAVELQQNTEAIQAQTRDSTTEKQMTLVGWVATTPQLAELRQRVIDEGFDSLSAAEQRQWQNYVIGEMREWENSFYQSERGLFTASEFEAHRQRMTFQMSEQAPEGDAYRRQWLSGARNVFAPSFRAEIDRIVAEVDG